MKILAVCGMGVGSSLLLRMQAEKALKKLGATADFDVADIGTARGASRGVDIILTTAELAERLDGVTSRIVIIGNFLSLDEMVEKLGPAMRDAGAIQ
jgi:PTS system ascorbate-specific IIB component